MSRNQEPARNHETPDESQMEPDTGVRESDDRRRGARDSPSLMMLVLVATIGVLLYTTFLFDFSNRGNWIPYLMVLVAESVIIFQALIALWTILSSGHNPRGYRFHNAQNRIYGPDHKTIEPDTDLTQLPMYLHETPVALDVYITTYGEDLATIRRLLGRANARIARMACTANKRWFVGSITYVNGFEKQRYVAGHRSSATSPWQLDFAIGHGGECPAFASLTNAPLGEINALMDNFCTMMVGPLLLLGNPITFDGVGSLRIGMAASEAERLGYIDSGNDCNEGYSMSLGSDRLGIGIQVTGGRVNALTVGAPFRTLSGARVGMTDAQVARIYPKSTRGVGIIGFGQMRSITSNGKRIMFNLDGENVMSIRVDTLAKPWGEGC